MDYNMSQWNDSVIHQNDALVRVYGAFLFVAGLLCLLGIFKENKNAISMAQVAEAVAMVLAPITLIVEMGFVAQVLIVQVLWAAVFFGYFWFYVMNLFKDSLPTL